MQTRGSNWNLKKANTPAGTVEKWEVLVLPEIDSWQPKVLAVEGPRHNYWLVDLAADIHVCNNQLLMTEYQEQPTKIGRSTSDRISPSREKIRLRLGLKNGLEGLVLNLNNVYYLLYSPCNLISLELLNNSGIYHNNENKTLYKVKTRQIFAQIQRWKKNYLLKLLNLFDNAVNLLKVDSSTYQPPSIL